MQLGAGRKMVKKRLRVGGLDSYRQFKKKHMAISTDSIIHYTEEYKTLISIISEGFKIKYCVEILKTRNNKTSSSAHPMISFCDIPLSDSHRHFGLYGYYGIGLSKSWAKNMGINPVLYIDSESFIGECIKNAFSSFKGISGDHSTDIKEMIIQTKCFTKNYSGPLKRGVINDDNYKFYDEREWRFIPGKNDMGNKSRSLAKSTYLADKNKFNNDISSFRFKFSHSHISYIIVKATIEIPDMIEFLRTTFYKSITGSELDILLSKVCSTEQIIQDY